LVAAFSVRAEDVVALKGAFRLGLDKNKSLEAAAAIRSAAETRIVQTRSGLLPKVNYSQSWMRGGNPVFFFGSLLTQHQFAVQNLSWGH
jgi:hypothetical protein